MKNKQKRFREMPFVKSRVPNKVVAAVVVVVAAKMKPLFIYKKNQTIRFKNKIEVRV